MIIEKSKSIREQVYEKLRRLILDGSIAPGDRIIEAEYSKQFNISRTPLREAIRMLELEGLVENNQNGGGVVVKKFSYKEIYEIYKIRLALENIILEEVARIATQKEIDALEKILKKTKKAMENNDNEKTFELFSQFNQMTYKISKFTRISEMLNNINLYLQKIRMLSIKDISRKEAAYDDHKKILEAIKERDVKKVVMVNNKHLNVSMDFIVKFFGEKNKEL